MRNILKVLKEHPELTRLDGGGDYGHYRLRFNEKTYAMIITAGAALPEAEGWEHVSIHIRYMTKKRNKRVMKMRTPTWEEMCIIKELFFEDDECAVQFHPPKSDYVNVHPYVLHLWHNKNQALLMPPIGLV